MNDVADTPQAREVPRKKRRTRGFWVRQLHSWHWISSAIAMVGLLLFTVTGFTLNHAADISAEPVVRDGTATLSATSLAALNAPAGETGAQDETARPIPDEVRAEISETTGLSVRANDAEWDDAEVYLALPRPGGDAWLAIDRADGAITWETTDRGWIAYLNDLHKGRDTGAVWRWFIDIFALGSLVFIGTGFVLMYLHSRNRPATWPVTGLGLLVPILLALLFIH